MAIKGAGDKRRGMSCGGCNAVWAAVVSTAGGIRQDAVWLFVSTLNQEPSSCSAGMMPGTVGFWPSTEPPVGAGDGRWQLPL